MKTAVEVLKERLGGEGQYKNFCSNLTKECHQNVLHAIEDHGNQFKKNDSENNDISLDHNKNIVILNGKEIQLQKTPFKVFDVLIQNRGNYISVTKIMEKVYVGVVVGEAVVRVMISNIKSQLPGLIVNKKGLGYMLKNPES